MFNEPDESDPVADSWSSCPHYPEWIETASGTAFDGKLYVKGNVMQVYESAVFYGKLYGIS